MINKEKKYLDLAGLTTYHNEVVNALNEKAAKPHIGDDEPTSAGVNIWLDTSEDNSEVQEASTYSMRRTSEEKLTFNETAEDEELTSNDETEEELTFNETAEDEKLTFNETTDEEHLTFNE